MNSWPEMGHGNVAVGECKRADDNTAGLIYLRLDEARKIGDDTGDVYPVGEAANDEKVLACIYFSTAESIQQTIDILQEIKLNRFTPNAI